jgi:hypothetical protein
VGFRGLDRDFVQGYKNDLQELINAGTARQRAVEQIHERIREDLRTFKRAANSMFDDGTYDRLTALVPNASSGNQSWQAVTGRKAALRGRIALLDSDEFMSKVTALIS